MLAKKRKTTTKETTFVILTVNEFYCPGKSFLRKFFHRLKVMGKLKKLALKNVLKF